MYYQSFSIHHTLACGLHETLEKEGEAKFIEEILEYEMDFEDSNKMTHTDFNVENSAASYKNYQKNNPDYYSFVTPTHVILGSKKNAIVGYKKIKE